MVLSVQMNQKDEFKDITEPFEYIYPEEEIIGGISYKHILGGIYCPPTPIVLEGQKYRELLEEYWDLKFGVEKTEKRMSEDDIYEDDNEPVTIYFVTSATMGKCDIYQMEQSDKEKYEVFLEASGLKGKGVEIIEVDTYFYEQRYEKASSFPESKLCYFKHPDKDNRYMGYRKHIQIKECIGYLIEPGIYFFPDKEQKYLENALILDINSCTELELAALGYATDYHFSFDMGVNYLAVGKENFDKLKQIQRTFPNTFVHVFTPKKKQEKQSEEGTLNLEDILAEQGSYQEEMEKKRAALQQEIENSESQIKEIFPGIGVYDIVLSYKYVFHKRVDRATYEAVYLENDFLILVEYDYKSDEFKKKKIELRLLEELTIQKIETLSGGFQMTRNICVIDSDKEKEVLTEEAYELWKNIEGEEKM